MAVLLDSLGTGAARSKTSDTTVQGTRQTHWAKAIDVPWSQVGSVLHRRRSCLSGKIRGSAERMSECET